MSDENKGPFPYNPFSDDSSRGINDEPNFFPFDNSSMYDPSQTLQGFEDPYSSHMSFTDCLRGSMDYTTLSRAFDMSCSSSSEVVSAAGEDGSGKGGENPATPGSVLSSSSTEAAAEGEEDDAGKCKDGDDKSNKVSKPRKKGEKKERVQRFAFMTKSEIDQLEDGYRWRKYGQKAVKNSPYPRSYYKCTSQKCTVKKRVERSFEDPSTVITTYEGQHNHHCPATLRGNAAAGMLSSSLFPSASPEGSSFTKELLSQMLPTSIDSSSSSGQRYFQGLGHRQPPQSQLSADYGLLQDMLPPFSHKQEP
uniref:WRKY transcription factor 15 n=1 Tax=Santalum album TaxID=35974 RepID=A0A650C2W3_SANAL|nr:WRKY transcription factor 15 [Santalum album]